MRPTANSGTVSLLSLLMILALTPACSDDGEAVAPDSADAAGDMTPLVDKDNSGLPDGYKLWPCKTPGAACNAHDPCAYNAVCGKDYLCRPSVLQNCDDKLDCTTDSCGTGGICNNIPKSGYCMLAVIKGAGGGDAGGGDAGGGDAGGDGGPDAGPVTTELRCFQTGDKKPGDPCSSCNPTETDAGVQNAKKWMPVTGGGCDDKEPCSKDDVCVAGTCKGTWYGGTCQDSISCTEDRCDGKGGCILGHPIKSGWCLISTKCYKSGTSHPSGSCSTCDPTKSTTAWTPIVNSCLIDGKCYAKGAKNTGGCAECDPTTSATAWTVKGTSHCYIDSTCVAAGAKDPSGCSACTPAKNKYAWTALSGICLISGKCYTKGAKHPLGCAECDPAVSNTTWTVKGSNCFFSGLCYKAGAADTSGCYTCQPSVSTVSFSPLAVHCKAGNKCYAPAAGHPQGCATCKTAAGKTSWTVSGTSHCMIDGACVASGAVHSGGCATCSPATALYAWTPKAGFCSIQSKCLASGAKHPEGCAQCSPASSKNSWTLTDSKRCLLNHQCGDYCSGKCVYLQTDSKNCGKCGTACPTKFVCKAGTCKPDCQVIASFEAGTWPGSWIRKDGSTGTTAAAYAHDGSLGGYNLGWHYYPGISFGKPGDRIFTWTRFGAATGRAYLGFSATSSGTWSVVMSSNTSALIVQQNSAWGYSDKKTVPGSFVNGQWYKLQAEVLIGNLLKATVYAADGKTVVISTTYPMASAPVGGAAIRTVGDHQVDTISVCKN